MTFGEKGGITMFYFFKNNVKSKYDKMLLIWDWGCCLPWKIKLWGRGT